MSYIPQTPQGFAPFDQPVAIPGVAWNAAPLVCIQINQTWATYVLGACFALLKRSTWDTTDKTAIDSTIQNAVQLMGAIAAFEACPMPIQFQVDPTDDRHWEYSLDGGATWLDGPLTNVSAPDDAIITDPTSLLRNTIDLAATGADGLIIKALANIGVQLQKGGIAAFFQKIPGLGLAADAVIQIAGADTYDNPIIETTLP